MSGSDDGSWTNPIRFKDMFGVFVLSPDEVEFRTGVTSGHSIVVSDSERRGILASIIERILSPHSVHSRPWNATESELLFELMPQLEESGVAAGGTGQAKSSSNSSTTILRKPVAQARLAIVGHGVLGEAIRTLLVDLPCGPPAVIESSSSAKKSHDDAFAPAEQPAASGRVLARPTCHSQWIATLQSYDWVIAAQDCFEPEELAALNKAALELRLPWSLVCFDGYEGWVGPTFVPGQTACFGCFRKRLFAAATEPKHVFSEPGVKVHRLSSPWSVGLESRPWISLIASMFALDVIAASEGKGFTLGHFLTVHRLHLTFQREAVLRLPRCEDCGPRHDAPRSNVFSHLLSTRPPGPAER